MPTTEERRNKVRLTLYDCPEFRIDGVLFGKKMHLHLEWPEKHLTPSLYKKGLMAVKMIRNGCKANGIEALYVFVPESLVKWEEMFGFIPIEKWTSKISSEPLYLMKQAA